MRPTVRRARPDEVDELLAMWNVLQQDQGEFRLFPRVADAEQRMRKVFEAATADQEEQCVLVVDDGGEIAGIALVSVREQSAHSMSEARVVELSSVVVRPDARKGGIGRMLVDAALAFGRERGAEYMSAKIFTRNVEALAFWERMGFEPRYEERIRRIDP